MTWGNAQNIESQRWSSNQTEFCAIHLTSFGPSCVRCTIHPDAKQGERHPHLPSSIKQQYSHIRHSPSSSTCPARNNGNQILLRVSIALINGCKWCGNRNCLRLVGESRSTSLKTTKEPQIVNTNTPFLKPTPSNTLLLAEVTSFWFPHHRASVSLFNT